MVFFIESQLSNLDSKATGLQLFPGRQDNEAPSERLKGKDIRLRADTIGIERVSEILPPTQTLLTKYHPLPSDHLLPATGMGDPLTASHSGQQ